MKMNSYILQDALQMFKRLCAISKQLSTSSSQTAAGAEDIDGLKKTKPKNSTQRLRDPTHLREFLEMST